MAPGPFGVHATPTVDTPVSMDTSAVSLKSCSTSSSSSSSSESSLPSMRSCVRDSSDDASSSSSSRSGLFGASSSSFGMCRGGSVCTSTAPQAAMYGLSAS